VFHLLLSLIGDPVFYYFCGSTKKFNHTIAMVSPCFKRNLFPDTASLTLPRLRQILPRHKMSDVSNG
jgi:hypothetical protein